MVRHVLNLQVNGRDDVLAVNGLNLVVVIQGFPLSFGDLLLQPFPFLSPEILIEAALDALRGPCSRHSPQPAPPFSRSDAHGRCAAPR